MIGIKPILYVVSLLAVAVAAGQLTETLRGRPVDQIVVADAGGDATGIGAVVGITPVAAEGAKGDDCAPTLRLAALPGAMIGLSLSAPCHVGQRVVLRHAGLSFTAVVGPDGHLQLQVPALEQLALVVAYLENSQVALGQILVPELASLSRFAVQIPSPAQFDLRVATEGRVYVNARNTLAENTARVLALGAAQAVDPVVAQVYTHPVPDLSTVDMTVDLRITAAICGRRLPVETWLSQNGTITRGMLSVDVPPCGTSGDILVLKNLLPALTLIPSD